MEARLTEENEVNLNQLFGSMGSTGNLIYGPWAAHAQGSIFAQQEAALAALGRQQAPVPAIEPEKRRQAEIKTKNCDNYARWLARIMREPLNDVKFY